MKGPVETPAIKLCPDCNMEMWIVQYTYDSPEYWDGFSEFMCPSCRIRIGRWSGKRLAEGESEPRANRFIGSN